MLKVSCPMDSCHFGNCQDDVSILGARKRSVAGNNRAMPRKAPPPRDPTGLFFAREFREMGQDELARLSGVSKGQISKLENGQRKLTKEYAEIFAPILQMPADRILFWEKFGGPTDDISSEDVSAALDAPPARMVKVVGYVGAGAETHYYAVSQGDLDEIPAPDNATDRTVAAEIKGSSLGKLMNGWYVFYDDIRRPVTPDLIGELCIVGLSDGRILVKGITKNHKPGHFDLISNAENEPPIEGVKIDWAAKIEGMRRK